MEGRKREQNYLEPMGIKISRTAPFQTSLKGDVKIMWMVTVVQPLPAVKLH